MRLIDADELKQALRQRQWHIDDIEEVMKIIDNAPTVTDRTEEVLSLQNTIAKLVEGIAENAKPQGEWEEPFEMYGKTYHKCNRCHVSSELILIGKYCPNCGADMRKGGAE